MTHFEDRTTNAGGLAPRQRHAQELARRIGEPLISGNRVELWADAEASRDAMLEAIDAAADHVNLETCRCDDDALADALAARLAACSRRGVRVNLLFDHVGARHDAGAGFAALRDAGGSVCEYRPARRGRAWFVDALRLRRPRRLLVVDGRVGFVGGCGAGDLHARLRGPVLQRLQRLFIAQWQRYASAPMQHARYFPALAPAGTQRVGIAAGDGVRGHAFGTALLGAVASARHAVTLAIVDALPPRSLQLALMRSAARGVAVELLLAPAGDDRAALPAWQRLRMAELLRAGVRVHERRHGALHANAGVVDGVWAGVGYGHIDWRATLQGATADLVLVDEAAALRLGQLLAEEPRAAPRVDVAPPADGWRGWTAALARRFEFF